MMRRTFVTFAAVAFAMLPASTFASLGGNVGTVEADRVQMKAAQLRIIRTSAYSFHELQSPTGVTVREYYGTDGTVFGVAWQGPWPPDMRQLLGPYFDRYHAEAERLVRARRGHGPLTVDLGDVVVQTAGHNRAFTGRIYMPAAAPQGVGIESIR